MERREFLKLSTLFAVGILLADSKLQAIAKLADPNKVVLYLIKNTKGQWKVLWTKYVDMPKRNLNTRFDRSTFQILDIVDECIANQRRKELWKQYECSGNTGAPINVQKATNAGFHVKNHRHSLQYQISDRKKESEKKWQSSGGTAVGLVQGKKNVESGHWKNVQNLGTQAFLEKYNGTEDHLSWSSKGGKSAVEVNKERGNFIKLGEQATKRHKAKWSKILEQMPLTFTKEELTKICSSGKVAYNICNSDLVEHVSGKGVPFDPKIFMKKPA